MRAPWKHLLAPALAASLTQCDFLTGPKAQEVVDMFIGFCSNDAPPTAVAYKNEGGPWTGVTLDVNGNATIKVTNKLGLAIVEDFGSDFSTEVIYGTVAELGSLVSGSCDVVRSGTKTLNGSVNTLSSGQFADISMAGTSTFVFAGGSSSFQLVGLPDDALDLVGVRSLNGVPDKVIVRRGLDLLNNATIPVLDFAATEAVAPASNTLTITGAGSDELFVDVIFLTAAGTQHFFFPPAIGQSTAIFGVPASLTLSTDIHTTSVFAAALSGTTARGLIFFNRDLANRTAVLGATVNTPSVSTVSTSPLRMRAELQSQADYNAVALIAFSQFSNGVQRDASVVVTSGYAGSTPAWDLEMPDLNSLSGFPDGANMVNGVATEWAVVATDATLTELLSERGEDGGSARFGLRTSSANALLVAGESNAVQASNRFRALRRLGFRR